MQTMQSSSHLAPGNAAYIDELYEQYLINPDSVLPEWRKYFDELPQINGQMQEVSHAKIREQLKYQAQQPLIKIATTTQVNEQHAKQQAHVLQLINAYRAHGHHQANLDPLQITERLHIDDLQLSHHQLGEQDLDMQFSSESSLTHNGASLREILKRLQRTYCDTLGIEYMHISDTRQLKWLQQRLESVQSHPELTVEEKTHILERLTAAEGLEKYLGSRFVGQKRFSLEGGDSLIPLLDKLIQQLSQHEVKELVLGMAHRGRLNVLVNILGKAPSDLFEEFAGKYYDEMSGDVKYHMGFSSDISPLNGNNLHLTLAFNPSHLEIIGPVVEGSVRARQRRRNDLARKMQVVPIVIHGDAAFAGQGVVMETFNFSQARGYSTGGTVHIVINNQIGFTTSNPLDARSTLYCTDVAKMVQAPILHVNGDDPEMVVFAAKLAADYRMEFGKDIVIDLVCYRRHGHNEADEPAVTQPKMYANIRKRPTTRALYAQRLTQENIITEVEADKMLDNYRASLDQGQSVVKLQSGNRDEFLVDWTPFLGHDWRAECKTGIAQADVKRYTQIFEQLPEGFTLHPQIKKLFAEYKKMAAGKELMNWGFAEIMAYASLVAEGKPVRISGQDSGRGTFAHRHAVLHDYNNGDVHIPIQHLSNKPNGFIIIDSVLSEEAVLAFEYGYATAEPNALVIWEAQFGDFANGAQVVIDQFISSGEQKWGRLCGLVMLLPHGYEGQGPEHSSARLERYMQLCAQQNIQVCVPSTPAQTFHMLRRQIIRPLRKPLIVMTPKSLLRHKLAVSPVIDLVEGHFHVVIPEVEAIAPSKVKRIVLCSGKVYYDLLQERQNLQREDIVLIRIEQLYPFPEIELTAELEKYGRVKEVVWCQEEPENQGAWYHIQHHLQACLQKQQQLSYAGRKPSASPAVGSPILHKKEQADVIAQALGI